MLRIRREGRGYGPREDERRPAGEVAEGRLARERVLDLGWAWDRHVASGQGGFLGQDLAEPLRFCFAEGRAEEPEIAHGSAHQMNPRRRHVGAAVDDASGIVGLVKGLQMQLCQGKRRGSHRVKHARDHATMSPERAAAHAGLGQVHS